MRKLNAFDRFYGNQTPANAVALAYADHTQQAVKSWEFADALAQAEHRCLAYDVLMTAVRNIAAYSLDKDSRLMAREAIGRAAVCATEVV